MAQCAVAARHRPRSPPAIATLGAPPPPSCNGDSVALTYRAALARARVGASRSGSLERERARTRSLRPLAQFALLQQKSLAALYTAAATRRLRQDLTPAAAAAKAAAMKRARVRPLAHAARATRGPTYGPAFCDVAPLSARGHAT